MKIITDKNIDTSTAKYWCIASDKYFLAILDDLDYKAKKLIKNKDFQQIIINKAQTYDNVIKSQSVNEAFPAVGVAVLKFLGSAAAWMGFDAAISYCNNDELDELKNNDTSNTALANNASNLGTNPMIYSQVAKGMSDNQFMQIYKKLQQLEDANPQYRWINKYDSDGKISYTFKTHTDDVKQRNDIFNELNNMNKDNVGFVIAFRNWFKKQPPALVAPGTRVNGVLDYFNNVKNDKASFSPDAGYSDKPPINAINDELKAKKEFDKTIDDANIPEEDIEKPNYALYIGVAAALAISIPYIWKRIKLLTNKLTSGKCIAKCIFTANDQEYVFQYDLRKNEWKLKYNDIKILKYTPYPSEEEIKSFTKTQFAKTFVNKCKDYIERLYNVNDYRLLIDALKIANPDDDFNYIDYMFNNKKVITRNLYNMKVKTDW